MAVLRNNDVPAEQRDLLVARARSKGQSPQAYLGELIEREARFADNAELASRLRRGRVHGEQ